MGDAYKSGSTPPDDPARRVPVHFTREPVSILYSFENPLPAQLKVLETLNMNNFTAEAFFGNAFEGDFAMDAVGSGVFGTPAGSEMKYSVEIVSEVNLLVLPTTKLIYQKKPAYINTNSYYVVIDALLEDENGNTSTFSSLGGKDSEGIAADGNSQGDSDSTRYPRGKYYEKKLDLGTFAGKKIKSLVLTYNRKNIPANIDTTFITYIDAVQITD